MASSNGTAVPATKEHKFNPNFTQAVVDSIGPKATPRVRQLASSLIHHLHDYARENELTVDEWMASLDILNECGRWSDDKRNEGQLMCDIFGLESLVDEITYKLATDAEDEPTATAILGPFWRASAPQLPMGANIVQNPDGIGKGDRTWVHGIVTDYKTGKPIEGAVLDVWHTAPNGLYEQQDPDQPEMNLRGRFTTGKDGKYDFYCLRPVPYPIPYDGPVGKVLEALDRHAWRPGHIHFILTAPGYKPIVTQLFDRTSKYIEQDSVFAVKENLIVDFKPLKDDPKADFDLPHDFRMASFEDAKKHSVAGATEVSTAGI